MIILPAAVRGPTVRPRVNYASSQARGLVAAWTPGGYSLGVIDDFDANNGMVLFDAGQMQAHATFSGAISGGALRAPVPAYDSDKGLVVRNIRDGGSTGRRLALDDLSAHFSDASGATFTAWLKRDATSNVGFPCGLTTATSVGHYPYSSSIYCNVFRNDRLTVGAIPSGKSLTTWHHLAISSEVDDWYRLYYDGELWYSGTAENAIYLGSWFLLSSTDGAWQYSGYATDMRLYNRGLTEAEVRNIYRDSDALYARTTLIPATSGATPTVITVTSATFSFDPATLNTKADAVIETSSATFSLSGSPVAYSIGQLIEILSATWSWSASALSTNAATRLLMNAATFKVSGATVVVNASRVIPVVSATFGFAASTVSWLSATTLSVGAAVFNFYPASVSVSGLIGDLLRRGIVRMRRHRRHGRH